MHPLLQDILY